MEYWVLTQSVFRRDFFHFNQETIENNLEKSKNSQKHLQDILLDMKTSQLKISM